MHHKEFYRTPQSPTKAKSGQLMDVCGAILDPILLIMLQMLQMATDATDAASDLSNGAQTIMASTCPVGLKYVPQQRDSSLDVTLNMVEF